jgi:hypothetical protein
MEDRDVRDVSIVNHTLKKIYCAVMIAGWMVSVFFGVYKLGA